MIVDFLPRATYNGEMKGEKITKICACGKCFEDYMSNKRSGFCSLQCYWEARKNNPKYAGYWTGKQRAEMQGDKNPNWAGDEVSYRSLHTWLRKTKNKTGICEHCFLSKKTDWANKSHEYLRNLEDWLELCRKCHIEYDKPSRGRAKEIYGENY